MWSARPAGCRVVDGHDGRRRGDGPLSDADSGLRDPAPAGSEPGRRRLGLLAIVTAAVLVVDQITKTWALRELGDGPVGLFGGAQLRLAFNTRGAFGLGGSAVPFLALAALGLVAALAFRSDIVSRVGPALALGLVLGGALGNLADRIFRDPGLLRGAVVDFVDLGWWPVFNAADSAITMGCLMLLVAGWRDPR